MILLSNHTFILLGRNGFKIVRRNKSSTVTLTPQALKNQEIKSKPKFREEIIHALIKEHPSEATIILLNEITFHGVVDGEDEEKINAFFEHVPFPPNNVARLGISGNNKSHLFAVNRDLTENFCDLLLEGGWKIDHIVPIRFLTPEKIDLTFSNLSKLTKNKKLLQLGDFMGVEGNEEEVSESKEVVEGEQEGSVKNKLYIVIIIVLFIFIGWFLYVTFLGPKKDVLPTAQGPTLTPAPTTQAALLESATQSAQIEDKDELTMQILNGTGIPGEAANVQTILGELGYKNIEIGTADGLGSESTIIVFSQKVPDEVRDEVEKELETRFSDVDTEEVPDSNPYDILITLGGELRQDLQ